jgi:hypothetical protein
MRYSQRPGNTGHRGNWRQPTVRSLPQCRYGRRYEQWNQQRSYAPRQYPQLLQWSQADLRATGPYRACWRPPLPGARR